MSANYIMERIERMSLRTILIFPEFDNMDIIDEIREKYDPLAELVRPHITIVFPFEMDITNHELSMIIENRFRNIESFEIEMQGFSKCEDRFGNYLFLNIVNGAEIITQLHDLFYSNEFSAFDLKIPFVPHMTVGKLKTVDELNDAYNSIKGNMIMFKSEITKISVEMIGENEESIVVIEKNLR